MPRLCSSWPRFNRPRLMRISPASIRWASYYAEFSALLRRAPGGNGARRWDSLQFGGHSPPYLPATGTLGCVEVGRAQQRGVDLSLPPAAGIPRATQTQSSAVWLTAG